MYACEDKHSKIYSACMLAYYVSVYPKISCKILYGICQVSQEEARCLAKILAYKNLALSLHDLTYLISGLCQVRFLSRTMPHLQKFGKSNREHLSRIDKKQLARFLLRTMTYFTEIMQVKWGAELARNN